MWLSVHLEMLSYFVMLMGVGDDTFGCGYKTERRVCRWGHRGFFVDLNLLAALWHWVRLSLLGGGWGGVWCWWRWPVCRADDLVTIMCWSSRNSGSLNCHKRWWPLQVCIGIVWPWPLRLPLFFSLFWCSVLLCGFVELCSERVN